MLWEYLRLEAIQCNSVWRPKDPSKLPYYGVLQAFTLQSPKLLLEINMHQSRHQPLLPSHSSDTRTCPDKDAAVFPAPTNTTSARRLLTFSVRP